MQYITSFSPETHALYYSIRYEDNLNVYHEIFTRLAQTE